MVERVSHPLCCSCLTVISSPFISQIASIQDELRTYNDNVARIADLHARSLDNTDDAAAQRLSQQLDDIVADTSALSNVLKRRIKAIEKTSGQGRDGQIRKQQVSGALVAVFPQRSRVQKSDVRCEMSCRQA